MMNKQAAATLALEGLEKLSGVPRAVLRGGGGEVGELLRAKNSAGREAGEAIAQARGKVRAGVYPWSLGGPAGDYYEAEGRISGGKSLAGDLRKRLGLEKLAGAKRLLRLAARKDFRGPVGGLLAMVDSGVQDAAQKYKRRISKLSPDDLGRLGAGSFAQNTMASFKDEVNKQFAPGKHLQSLAGTLGAVPLGAARELAYARRVGGSVKDDVLTLARKATKAGPSSKTTLHDVLRAKKRKG